MVRRLIFLCAIVALAILAGTSRTVAQTTIIMTDTHSATDPKGAIREARESIAAGKMDVAIAQLEAYVQAHPGELEPHRFLGDLYMRIGQPDKAKAVYLQILATAPRDRETHNRLGTVYAVENQVDAAIAQFSAALPGTDSVDDLVSLHQRRGDLNAYRMQIESAARQDPGDAGTLSELGQIYNALHQSYSAVRYLKSALDDDPDDLTSQNALGLAYLNLGQYSDATDEFRHCLRSDPEMYSCADNLGATLLEMGDYTEAKVTLDRAYRMAPERGETFVNYGYLEDAQGNWQGAIAQYARAISTWPFVREAYIDIGLDYEEHHLYTLAQQVLVKGIASVNDDGRMHFLLGRAYEMQGDRSDALTQFKLASTGTDPTAVRIGAERFSELTSSETPQPQ